MLVIIDLPAPEVMTVALEIGDVQVASLWSVTVAASDRVNVTVGFCDVPNALGEIEVYAIVGPVESITIAFWPDRLEGPPKVGRPRAAVFPAISVIVPPFNAKADVDATSSGLAF
jgi:hypothetical protein